MPQILEIYSIMLKLKMTIIYILKALMEKVEDMSDKRDNFTKDVKS